RAAGTRATWYWKASHLKPPQARKPEVDRASWDAVALVAAAQGHEVALHTERPWTEGSEDLQVLRQATGSGPHGSSAHGAPDCFGFQGAPNVLWADEQGLAYTEL